MKKNIIPVFTAVVFGIGLITPAQADVNCGSFRSHAKRANCYRQMQNVYRNQQRTYESNARMYNRVHKGTGRALGYVPGVGKHLQRGWNAPRYLNQGYNYYRGR